MRSTERSMRPVGPFDTLPLLLRAAPLLLVKSMRAASPTLDLDHKL
jgi:hypothetical protein